MIPVHHAVEFQKHLWDDILPSSKVVVDMTCGNGHDTLYIAKYSHPEAQVHAIDIQEIALHQSKERIQKDGTEIFHKVKFHLGSHEQVLKDLHLESIDLLVANLGYLPQSDHSIMTSSKTTIEALTVGLPKLSSIGLCTIVAYPGTEVGKEEMHGVEAYLSGLSQYEYHCSCWKPMNQKNNPPVLYSIRRRL